jgi:hypothetical protein
MPIQRTATSRPRGESLNEVPPTQRCGSRDQTFLLFMQRATHLSFKNPNSQRRSLLAKEDNMNRSSPTQPGSDKDAIRPFPKINFPEAELTELRRRINNTRWPESLQDVAA